MGRAEGLRDGDRVTVHPYFLKDMEEVRGHLHGIEEIDAGFVATIGKISAILPSELAGELQSLVGQRVGVIRLDGQYRAKAL